MLQVQYSLLSRGIQQEEIRAACQDLGVQLIAYSPLALGMLSGEHALGDYLQVVYTYITVSITPMCQDLGAHCSQPSGTWHAVR